MRHVKKHAFGRIVYFQQNENALDGTLSKRIFCNNL